MSASGQTRSTVDNGDEPTRVDQIKEPVVTSYSLVYQKVQSSTGSMFIEA